MACTELGGSSLGKTINSVSGREVSPLKGRWQWYASLDKKNGCSLWYNWNFSSENMTQCSIPKLSLLFFQLKLGHSFSHSLPGRDIVALWTKRNCQAQPRVFVFLLKSNRNSFGQESPSLKFSGACKYDMDPSITCQGFWLCLYSVMHLLYYVEWLWHWSKFKFKMGVKNIGSHGTNMYDVSIFQALPKLFLN